MLRFELHLLDLGEQKVVPLPKLIPEQLMILASRFNELGFKVALGRTISARREGLYLSVHPAGLCLSNCDPIDIIAPVIPEILSVPRRHLDSRVILGEYFQSKSKQRNLTVRFNTRLESGSRWRLLRGINQSGLTPDEHLMVNSVLKGATGELRVLTDFPVDGSRRRIVGSRQFYDSLLTSSEVISSLGFLGREGGRNSYLPEKSVLVFESRWRNPFADWEKALTQLGEWCYLEPIRHERSN